MSTLQSLQLELSQHYEESFHRIESAQKDAEKKMESIRKEALDLLEKESEEAMKIREEKGKLTSIIIKKRPFGKTHRIESKSIKTIGFNIILNEEASSVIRH